MGGYVFVRLVLQLSTHGTRGMGGYFTTGRTRALLPLTSCSSWVVVDSTAVVYSVSSTGYCPRRNARGERPR